MQFKSLAVIILGASLAAATAIPASQCNTGPVQCCDSTGTAKDPSISKLLGLLNINVSDVDALVGVTCTPITVIGAGGSSCAAQPVCCSNNSFKGVVAIGCTPVSL
ncbi:hydrophobin-315 [Crepidotus variabilis]|uniref:Hydrophobin n=1 Tax=Crepidotus variabilis TaxID=179855 RepID=A0A9P6E563_9AGAR|nr:hydrophobin-315 [Crepidotus variabilis]